MMTINKASSTLENTATRLHPVMEQLILDHKHLSLLINALENHFRAFITGNDDEDGALLPSILESMDYIETYPQTWHHPAEEKAFDQLMTKSLSDEDTHAILKVRKQHRELEKQSHQLRDYFERIAKDSIVDVHTLTQVFSDYLDQQRYHIETENMFVFPLLMSKLGDADWEKVATQVIPAIDPLFRQRSEQEYRALAKLLHEYEREKH